jgi:hypothetical protein
MALGHSSVQTKGVKTVWNILVEHFGNEVEALIHSEPEDLKVVNKRIVDAILAFRKGNVIIHPGGGGHYGWLELPENFKVEKFESCMKEGSGMKKNSKYSKCGQVKQIDHIVFSDLGKINHVKKNEKKFKKKNEELNNEKIDNSKCQSSLFDF